MRKIVLAGELSVGAIGLGCSSMSYGYGPPERNDAESTRVIQTAIDYGVTLFDTADVYGPFSNELLLGKALKGRRDEVVLATKCGLVGGPDGKLSRNGRPDHLKAACAESLSRLGTDVIDLYQLHRIDPEVPLEETWGALADLVRAGYVRGLGISHATLEELDRVHAVFPITAVQYELSVWATGHRSGVLPWSARNGVGFLAFSPIGRGYLTGKLDSQMLAPADSRSRDPRFTREAMAANNAIVRGLNEVAARHRATPAQVAIAWAGAQGDNVVPIPGTKQRRWLRENVQAARLQLTDEDFRAIAALPDPVGHMSWDLARAGTTGQGVVTAGG